MPRVSRIPDPVAGLSRLREDPDLADAVRLVEASSEHLALLTLLTAQPSEAVVCAFLAERQHLLRATFGCYHPGDTAVCKKEFQFGRSFALTSSCCTHAGRFRPYSTSLSSSLSPTQSSQGRERPPPDFWGR